MWSCCGGLPRHLRSSSAMCALCARRAGATTRLLQPGLLHRQQAVWTIDGGWEWWPGCSWLCTSTQALLQPGWHWHLALLCFRTCQSA